MNDIKTFLKVLNKVGYPNPDTESIAKMIDYNLEDFLPDLVAEVGQEKAEEFTFKALSKLSTNKGIKVTNIYDYPEQYAYINVYNSRINLDNDEGTVLCDWSWGDTKLLSQDDDGNETYKTIEEIGDEVGMGEWADYDDLVDEIRGDCNKLVFKNCGFGIWWDDQHGDLKK